MYYSRTGRCEASRSESFEKLEELHAPIGFSQSVSRRSSAREAANPHDTLEGDGRRLGDPIITFLTMLMTIVIIALLITLLSFIIIIIIIIIQLIIIQIIIIIIIIIIILTTAK